MSEHLEIISRLFYYEPHQQKNPCQADPKRYAQVFAKCLHNDLGLKRMIPLEQLKCTCTVKVTMYLPNKNSLNNGSFFESMHLKNSANQQQATQVLYLMMTKLLRAWRLVKINIHDFDIALIVGQLRGINHIPPPMCIMLQVKDLCKVNIAASKVFQYINLQMS